MTHDTSVRLPDIFPTNEIEVDEEDHLYETFEGDSGTVLEKREYTLDKAPIDEFVEVTGVVNGQTFTFTEGTDYELSNDDNRIVWKDDPADRPDAGSIFYVTYRADSIISRYLSSNEEELDSIDEQLEEVISSKFVDSATGQELDEIGSLFGDTIGKRRGRSDTQYRTYLKSVVQSFVSRGTKNGIKLAVSAATGIPIEDITINEDFQNNEYELEIIPRTPINTPLISEVAEIADPSGVFLDGLRVTPFAANPDEMGVEDDNTFIISTASPSDDMGVDDATASNRRAATDTLFGDDSNAISPNLTSTSDTLASDEAVIIDGDTTSSTDGAAANDATTISVGTTDDLLWQPSGGTENWNERQWMQIEDTTVSAGDDISADDAVTTTVESSDLEWQPEGGDDSWDEMQWVA